MENENNAFSDYTEESPVQEEAVIASSKESDRKDQGLAYEIYSLLHDVVYILAVVTIIFVFVVRLVGVDGESMLPTLHNRDYVLLESNFLYKPEDVQTGDIVVLSVPYYADEGSIVKRVIATEGQTVDIDFDRGVVYVDGVMLEEDYTNSLTTANWDPPYALEYPATVPENCIFVLGDNRNASTDSRFAPVGMIDESCILGKVILILLPGQTRDAYGNVTSPRDWSRIGAVS
jgi:signal peptidase I